MLIYLFIDELYLCEFCIVFLFLNFNLFDIYLLFVIFVEIKFIFLKVMIINIMFIV